MYAPEYQSLKYKKQKLTELKREYTIAHSIFNTHSQQLIELLEQKYH